MYKFSENNGGYHLYTVGFYTPNGDFHTDSDGTKEECAKRVHYLNGGNETTTIPSVEMASLMMAQGLAFRSGFPLSSIVKDSVFIAKAVLELANK